MVCARKSTVVKRLLIWLERLAKMSESFLVEMPESMEWLA